MASKIASRRAFSGNKHPMGEPAGKRSKPGTMKMKQIKHLKPMKG